MRSGAPRIVSHCPSSAASFTGCVTATTRALTSPEIGWSTAAGPPTQSASASARRWNAGAAPRSSIQAWMPGDGDARRRVRREQHVQRLLERGGTAHRGDGIDARERARRIEREPDRRVHPRVDEHDEHGRRRAARRHDDAGREMRARTDALPAVQVDAEEDRLEEEGKTFK